jgi:hypothetical protein
MRESAKNKLCRRRGKVFLGPARATRFAKRVPARAFDSLIAAQL